jgi:hypothetical protein
LITIGFITIADIVIIIGRRRDTRDIRNIGWFSNSLVKDIEPCIQIIIHHQKILPYSGNDLTLFSSGAILCLRACGIIIGAHIVGGQVFRIRTFAPDTRLLA